MRDGCLVLRGSCLRPQHPVIAPAVTDMSALRRTERSVLAAAGLILGILGTVTDAAALPPAQFLADVSDGVQRKCGAPGPSPCIFPSAPGDSSLTVQAVTASDSGVDIEGPFSGMASASTSVGGTIASLGASVRAGFSKTPGQPAAEALMRFSVGVQPLSPQAPNVPVPVNVIVNLSASADVSPVSNNGEIEAREFWKRTP